MTTSPSDARDRFGWPVNDWAAAVGISRASAYNLMTEGKIQSVKYLSKRLIITHPREFLASLARGEAA